MDGFVIAAGDGKAWAVDGYDFGDYRGQIHLRGGMIANHYGAFGTFGTYRRVMQTGPCGANHRTAPW